MDTYEDSEKYFTTKENLKSTLTEYGVAIIPSVISEEKRELIYENMWNYIENLTKSWEIPITQSNKKSWKEIYKLFPLHSMLLQYFNIGHAQFAWDARQDENIINIFASLWNVNNNDLLVSFDGSSLHLPSEETNRGWHRKPWFHTDQSYTRPEYECIQSFLSLLDIEKGDGTLAILEKSHLLHLDFQKHFNIHDKSDWFKLNDEHIHWYQSIKKCHEKRITCPKGSLVFWDSRTIHCGVEPLKQRPRPTIRAVIYLCYKPRPIDLKNDKKQNKLNEKMFLKKRKAFEELRTCTHYPDKVKLFAKTPRTYGAKIPPTTPLEPPILTPIGKRLAGFS